MICGNGKHYFANFALHFQLCKTHNNKLPCPAMNTHDAVTKTMLDNYYSQKESVVDALKRCTDCMLAGRTILVCGYGQVGGK